jgi:ParB family chromosome partitioning protein
MLVNTDSRVLQVPIEDIIPNRFQPRLAFDDASLQELAGSIKQHGIIQPLVLRRAGDKYEIIAGERRYKAATMAGLTSVPAILSNLNDNDSAEVAVVENIQRKDLTSIEEARSYKALLDKGYMSQDELARKMGISQSAISNKLRLLTLDDEVQQAILNEEISERHARSLLKLKDKEDQKRLLKRIINERLTVKQLESEIKKITGDDVPLVNNQINIDTIKAKAEDIKPLEPVKEEQLTTSKAEDNETVPDKMPNRFFNFLEDYSANMNMDDTPSDEAETTEEPKEDAVSIPDVSDEEMPSKKEKNESLKEEQDDLDIFNFNPETTEDSEEIVTPNISVDTNDSVPQTEEVEMLDDFNIPEEPHDPEIIKQIQNIVDKNPKAKIIITENDETYELIITIKKD